MNFFYSMKELTAITTRRLCDDNVANMVPRQMGMVVEEGGLYFHSGLTTCTHSSSRDLTLTPMRMSMPMPTTTSTSTTTSTRYRLPGTLIASHLPTITSRITITVTITITRITITIIAIITIIITITTTTIRFKSISISPEISVIETPVSGCKVTRKPEQEQVVSRNVRVLFWPDLIAQLLFLSADFTVCTTLIDMNGFLRYLARKKSPRCVSPRCVIHTNANEFFPHYES